MTHEEILQKFGLPASLHHRHEIRRLLTGEIARAQREWGCDEILRALCLQLFSLGVVEDALLIWSAKRSNFDASCGLDVQFLCGAGLITTKEYLAKSSAQYASEALGYLTECEQAEDFADWTPQKTIADYRRYYGLR